ncbi:MAG: SseB family protein [Nocardioides sp.]|uniref:SseB family protein n=1 Tax=Nocardioides sp. TaxID=35761 RepID=UPI0039E6FE1C
MEQHPDQKRISGPGFAGDEGSAKPAVASALSAFATRRGTYAVALAALLDSRVLVPVVAVLGTVEHRASGLARDKTSDMATVLLTGADGRRALLAFTSTESLRAWRADARPVPVGFRDAAMAALQEEADAIVVDVAGPVTFPIEGEDLRAAAAGLGLAFVGDSSAWVSPVARDSHGSD